MSVPSSATPTTAPRADNEHPFRYDAALADQIETRWQQYWAEHRTFVTPNPGAVGFDPAKPKFFCMDMFPYPSGVGLHVGHPEGYIATDIVCRFKRMKGFNVLHPMGWDAFGLPAEQYAIQTGVHPVVTTKKAIDNFRRQLQRFGFSYDWSREIATMDPAYYRWTQWIWLKCYDAWYDPIQNKARLIDELIQDLENGHAYINAWGELVPGGPQGAIEVLAGQPIGARKWHELSEQERRELIDEQRLAYLGEQMVNWCPKLGTVLANEEVIDGRSERGGYPVVRRPLKQWMFRITAYAERLLNDLNALAWPESTKSMQAAWIGRSEGAEIDFPAVARLSESGVWIDSPVPYPLTAPGFVARDPYPQGEPSPSELVRKRRKMPHLELPGATYFVTWCTLDDSELLPEDRDTTLAALRHFDDERCRVYAATVMPDHVHWIVQPRAGNTLSALVESVKRYSATKINHRRGSQGALWEPERFDHIVRDVERFADFMFYVVRNPVTRGLVEQPSHYPWTYVDPVIKLVDLPGQTDTPDSESRATLIRIFTTRPDTIFGATYMVLAPEHPLVEEITKPEQRAAVRAYQQQAAAKSDVDRQAQAKVKTGVFTGTYVLNPATNQPIPVWIADYVLMGYGTGAIMAVPGQDQRDWDFARAFNLPIVRTVQPPPDFQGEAYLGDGLAINSANDEVSLNGQGVVEAKKTIIDWLERTARGTRTVNYKLRDWLFSRQRYWGEPFPIVYDEQGNHYPISESHLPVELPPLEDYKPIESDDPQPLLAKATGWATTTAGEAGVSPDLLPPQTKVKRETNTMPGWAGSCWYCLRYCDPHNAARFVGREAERYWMLSPKASKVARLSESGGPAVSSSSDESITSSRLGESGYLRDAHHIGGVDLYIGGAEHAVLHLLYARFWHKILFDLGEVSTPEPFGRLFHQGLITSFSYQRKDKTLVPTDQVKEVREGEYIEIASGEKLTQVIAKMSKSLKNVVNPDDIIAEYGADTFRLYEMYMGPLEASKPWNTRDITGLFRFLQRTWRVAVDENSGALRLAASRDEAIEKQLHRTIAKVAHDIERLAFNTAIAAMIEFINLASARGEKLGSADVGAITREQLERFTLVLAPFAPHLAEELWSKLGHAQPLASSPWPAHDQALLRDADIELPVQINGKVKGKITVPAASGGDETRVKEIALTDEKIKAQLEGKTVRKFILVPGKIVNIVAN